MTGTLQELIAPPGPGGPPTGNRAVTEVPPSRRRRGPLVPLLLVLAGIGVLLYPVAATQYNNYHQHEFAQRYRDEIKAVPSDVLAEDRRQARAYNKTLEGVPILDPWLTRVTSSPESSAYRTYLSQLALSDAMATVLVPSVGIDLPVYHGTTDKAMSRGAGHLYGTSLPVGGRSTHAVLTSHTGLATATLFDHLVDVRRGDKIYVEVDGRTLAYEVDQIKVVLPSEIEDLTAIDGQDLITLFTCTPYAVNSHRLLVRGHRVPYSDASDPAPRADEPLRLVTWMWWLIAVSVGSVVLMLWLFVRDRRRRRRDRSSGAAQQAGDVRPGRAGSARRR